ncbi:hypothetical protein [Variovorax sp. SRS16]|uniref:hypothetical protein n=1 Tax=Variovorax sp. SRS16 TaxID=282217 RepID=UPI0013A59CE1|nr:hypothetical protein [Variovorax sp. SRS16]
MVSTFSVIGETILCNPPCTAVGADPGGLSESTIGACTTKGLAIVVPDIPWRIAGFSITLRADRDPHRRRDHRDAGDHPGTHRLVFRWQLPAPLFSCAQLTDPMAHTGPGSVRALRIAADTFRNDD